MSLYRLPLCGYVGYHYDSRRSGPVFTALCRFGYQHGQLRLKQIFQDLKTGEVRVEDVLARVSIEVARALRC